MSLYFSAFSALLDTLTLWDYLTVIKNLDENVQPWSRSLNPYAAGQLQLANTK